MMTITPQTKPTSGVTTAQRLTNTLDPKTWILIATLAIGWHTDGLTGIGWGFLGCLFAAVIPMICIRRSVRRGKLSDQYVGERRQRPLVLGLIALSVCTGIALMIGFDAPQTMIGLIVTMLITLLVLLAVSTVWKISIHAAVASGAVAMIAIAVSLWVLPAYALVAVVCWARVCLQDHTKLQVTVGAALGGLVSAAVFQLLA